MRATKTAAVRLRSIPLLHHLNGVLLHHQRALSRDAVGLGLVDLAPLAISCLSRPVVMRSSDAVVGFLRAVPCVQVRLRGRFARPTYALERQHAQAVLRVDLGTLSPAENVAAVHAPTPESSRRRRSSSRPPSTALGGSAATRAIRAWDRAGQRHRTRPRPSRPAPPNGCSGHPAGSSSGRSTVQPSTARGATRTRPMTHAARRRCGARDAPQQGRRAAPTSGPGQSADTRDLRPYEL